MRFGFFANLENRQDPGLRKKSRGFGLAPWSFTSSLFPSYTTNIATPAANIANVVIATRAHPQRELG
jgi:hypothetical protein